MRSRRLSFMAGWAAVGLLALAGFAAFGTPNPSSQELRVQAAADSIGHTSGAYAGLAFAQLGDVVSEASNGVSLAAETADSDEAADAASAEGTVAAPGTGWLSEVEVRALISVYFEPEDVNRAVRVAWCESRFDPESKNLRTGAVGIFQHLPRYWAERAENAAFAGVEPTDAEASIAAAAWEIYEGGGWDVFACKG